MNLPDKLFYKIGEISKIIGVEPYVIRYWEKEFPTIRPRKSRGGQRLYRRVDVETLIEIKGLLRDKGYTVIGARKVLASRHHTVEAQQTPKDPFQSASQTHQIENVQNGNDDHEALKKECQELYQERAVLTRELAEHRDTLLQVRRSMLGLLDELENLKKKKN